MATEKIILIVGFMVFLSVVYLGGMWLLWIAVRGGREISRRLYIWSLVISVSMVGASVPMMLYVGALTAYVLGPGE